MNGADLKLLIWRTHSFRPGTGKRAGFLNTHLDSFCHSAYGTEGIPFWHPRKAGIGREGSHARLYFCTFK